LLSTLSDAAARIHFDNWPSGEAPSRE
jgi:hypothetical protein